MTSLTFTVHEKESECVVVLKCHTVKPGPQMPLCYPQQRLLRSFQGIPTNGKKHEQRAHNQGKLECMLLVDSVDRGDRL